MKRWRNGFDNATKVLHSSGKRGRERTKNKCFSAIIRILSLSFSCLIKSHKITLAEGIPADLTRRD